MMDNTGQAPAISISRTSTESRASSKKATTPSTEHDNQQSQANNYRDYVWYQNKRKQHWKNRHEPDLTWHSKWDKDCFANGRVLIIDYISNQVSRSGNASDMRHVAVAAQEFDSLKGLESFYADRRRIRDAALRVIHVSNATWATQFLLKKFNIEHPNELVGMRNFGRWARYERPRQRNGKPFPNGRTFQTRSDPWRNVSCTAFGLDYLKCYPSTPAGQRHGERGAAGGPTDAQMMHLNAYEDSRSPHGHDVAVQRLSVYVQRSLGPVSNVPVNTAVNNPYLKRYPGEDPVAVEDLDNSSTVIVFETSASMLMQDCLIQPRNDFEKRWRRLSFYLRKEDVLSDARMAAQCTNFILTDVFHGLVIVWEQSLAVAADHVNILEDKIYENPADESRAPELWTNQAAWLKVEKVIYIHQDVVREMQGLLKEISTIDANEAESNRKAVIEEWLATTPAEYEKLAHAVKEDLVQPTANLSDLMYKSVGIRDSRQSLQASLSMWRLSWITFLFLPLTFIVSFFGMNVDIFENYPSIGWYFVAAVILMLGVLALWYCVKHSLQRRRQTPFQRGVYESLFHRLEDQYPSLWTSAGAVDDVEPRGYLDNLRWRLLRRWFAPDKTIYKRLYSSLDEDGADLGSIDRLKRFLLRRWLPLLAQRIAQNENNLALTDMAVSPRPSSELDAAEMGAIEVLAKSATPAAVAQGEPWALQRHGFPNLHPMDSRNSGRRSNSPASTPNERPDSRGSNGIMFEERNLSDSESDGTTDAVPEAQSHPLQGQSLSRHSNSVIAMYSI